MLGNADLRKRNNYKQFDVENHIGLSNYLAGLSSKEEVISKTNQPNLFILTSGDIPPNPSELLLSEKMDELIHYLKSEYDYIFLDTPPIGILSDGLELTKHSDVNIFMARQDYTLKDFIININHMYESGKIKNVALLFNDVNFSKHKYGYGYGYSYGYGYGYGFGYGFGYGNEYFQEEERSKSLWKRLLKI